MPEALKDGIRLMSKSLQSILDDLCEVVCGCNKHRVRIVPHMGQAVEQTQPVLKTPQYKGSIKGEVIMAFDLADSQQVVVSVAFVDKKGNPANVDGAPEWSTDNTDVLALTPEPNGMSCLVQAVGPLGAATVTLKADADLGAGTVPVIGTLDINVTGGAATVVTLTPGVPEEQP